MVGLQEDQGVIGDAAVGRGKQKRGRPRGSGRGNVDARAEGMVGVEGASAGIGQSQGQGQGRGRGQGRGKGLEDEAHRHAVEGVSTLPPVKRGRGRPRKDKNPAPLPSQCNTPNMVAVSTDLGFFPSPKITPNSANTLGPNPDLGIFPSPQVTPNSANTMFPSPQVIPNSANMMAPNPDLGCFPSPQVTPNAASASPAGTISPATLHVEPSVLHVEPSMGPTVKRKPGRPPKNSLAAGSAQTRITSPTPQTLHVELSTGPTVKRKPGRPRKNPLPVGSAQTRITSQIPQNQNMPGAPPSPTAPPPPSPPLPDTQSQQQHDWPPPPQEVAPQYPEPLPQLPEWFPEKFILPAVCNIQDILVPRDDESQQPLVYGCSWPAYTIHRFFHPPRIKRAKYRRKPATIINTQMPTAPSAQAQETQQQRQQDMPTEPLAQAQETQQQRQQDMPTEPLAQAQENQQPWQQEMSGAPEVGDNVYGWNVHQGHQVVQNPGGFRSDGNGSANWQYTQQCPQSLQQMGGNTQSQGAMLEQFMQQCELTNSGMEGNFYGSNSFNNGGEQGAQNLHGQASHGGFELGTRHEQGFMGNDVVQQISQQEGDNAQPQGAMRDQYMQQCQFTDRGVEGNFFGSNSFNNVGEQGAQILHGQAIHGGFEFGTRHEQGFTGNVVQQISQQEGGNAQLQGATTMDDEFTVEELGLLD